MKKLLAIAPIVFFLAASQVEASQTVYKLGDNSSYLQGCFPPCLCPIMESPVRGTFLVDRAPGTGATQNFRISDVNWLGELDGKLVSITGSGKYSIRNSQPKQHRLQLDLVVGDSGIQHFDSGVVEGGAEFPNLNITVSVNGMVCFDTAFAVNASPVAVSEVESYLIDGAGVMVEGCFDPCACPLSLLGIVSGTFELVSLGELSGKQAFSVVKLNWVVDGEDYAGADKTVKGFGYYLLDSSSKVEIQELALSLNIDGGPSQLFKSGPELSSFPIISSAVSLNGMYCFDTLFQFEAVPQ